MTRIAIILAMLITPTAWAQTTVDFAIVFGEMTIPTASAPDRRVMPVLRVPYEMCDEVEVAAQAALREQELAMAAQLAVDQPIFADWQPQSWALCYKESIAVQVIPSNTVEPILCVREYTEPFDWFAPCP